jgi:DNA-binding transcriptional LysR family regulator
LDRLDPALEHQPWHSERLVLAASFQNTLFDGLLVAEPAHIQRHACFLMLQKHFRMSEEISKYLDRHRVRCGRIEYLPTIADIKEQVIRDVGISLLPEPSVREERRTQRLTTLPLAFPLYRPVGILVRKDAKTRPALLKLVECFSRLDE